MLPSQGRDASSILVSRSHSEGFTISLFAAAIEMKQKKALRTNFSIKRILVGVSAGLLLSIILVLGLFAFEIWTDGPPQFFPLDNPAGEYKITRLCPQAQGWHELNYSKNLSADGYCLEYKGRDVFMDKENGYSSFFRITIGKSAMPIESLVGKKVKNIRGRFASASQQCILSRCINIGGPMVVLNIDSLELDR